MHPLRFKWWLFKRWFLRQFWTKRIHERETLKLAQINSWYEGWSYCEALIYGRYITTAFNIYEDGRSVLQIPRKWTPLTLPLYTTDGWFTD